MDDARAVRDRLGWDHPPFAVPDAVRADWAAAMSRGRQARAAWSDRHAAHANRAEFDRWTSGGLPRGWSAALGDAIPADAPRATILSSGDVCEALRDALPEIIVLCADLEAPTNHKRGRAAFTAADRAGTYVHCGVREHLMGAMANGIAAHGGLRPVAVTYLAFADYERAAIRMAALMRLPVLHVFSHDSIGVGSNGPTHQPVEVLAGFRAMPGIEVWRPADAAETRAAWTAALEARRPAMLALSKQPTPQVAADPPAVDGGYLLRDPARRAVTLIATGTEVAIALDAADRLAADGIAAAVLSLPSWERFAELADATRAALFGDAPRVAVEAAVRFGWDRWLRPTDRFVGMAGFGASARAEVLYAHFGITAEAVAGAGRDALA